MNGGGDTPALKTRFKLRQAANSAPGSVLCDNYGRVLLFSTGETAYGCIVVVDGVVTLINDIFSSAYDKSYDEYGSFEVEPVIAESAYTFDIEAVYAFVAETLTVTIGQPMTGVGNFVAVPANCYWRPAGANKVLCDSDGKMLMMSWGKTCTREDVISDNVDVGPVYFRAEDDAIRAGETWVDTPFSDLREQLLNDYDFVIIEPSEYQSNLYQIRLSSGAFLYYYNPGGGNLYQTPASFPDYVAP